MRRPIGSSAAASTDLQAIPGVGPSIARDLVELGYVTIADLCNEDPESMYQSLSRGRGKPLDRCVLYVFRCAVYFASHDEHEEELLRWWNWKDSAIAARLG